MPRHSKVRKRPRKLAGIGKKSYFCNRNQQQLADRMDYISVSQFAEKYGTSVRTARNYCATGKIDSAFLTGKTWNIIQQWGNINGYLHDTCLSAQDQFKTLLDYFRIKYQVNH